MNLLLVIFVYFFCWSLFLILFNKIEDKLIGFFFLLCDFVLCKFCFFIVVMWLCRVFCLELEFDLVILFLLLFLFLVLFFFLWMLNLFVFSWCNVGLLIICGLWILCNGFFWDVLGFMKVGFVGNLGFFIYFWVLIIGFVLGWYSLGDVFFIVGFFVFFVEFFIDFGELGFDGYVFLFLRLELLVFFIFNLLGLFVFGFGFVCGEVFEIK